MPGTDTPNLAQPGATTVAPSPPDWLQIKHDVSCPLCGYNLRGLIEPRCPECGYRFDWDKMLDPNAAMHPYLFEHHPERNLWSYYRTVLGACRPKRFWTTLHPRQPSRPVRLLLFWMLGCCSFPLVSIGFSASLVAVKENHRRASEGAVVRNLQASFGAGATVPSLGLTVPSGYLRNPSHEGWRGWLAEYASHPLNIRTPAPGITCWVFIWPWWTWATLMIFQISMRRAKVRSVHVLRCVIYSFDLIPWMVMTIPVYLALVLASFLFWLSSDENYLQGWWTLGRLMEDAVSLAIVVLGGLYCSFRLAAAYRLYLRFDRPGATVLASQVIAWLLALTAMSAWDPLLIAWFLPP